MLSQHKNMGHHRLWTSFCLKNQRRLALTRFLKSPYNLRNLNRLWWLLRKLTTPHPRIRVMQVVAPAMKFISTTSQTTTTKFKGKVCLKGKFSIPMQKLSQLLRTLLAMLQGPKFKIKVQTWVIALIAQAVTITANHFSTLVRTLWLNQMVLTVVTRARGTSLTTKCCWNSNSSSTSVSSTPNWQEEIKNWPMNTTIWKLHLTYLLLLHIHSSCSPLSTLDSTATRCTLSTPTACSLP